MPRFSTRCHARPLVAVIGLTLALAAPRPAAADHEGRLLGMALALPFITIGGAALAAAPFFAASAGAAETVAVRPRPATGSFRLQALSPWGDERITMLHLDFGGYPAGKHRFGWEGSFEAAGFANASGRDLFFRWDGRGLWHTGHLDDPVALQLLGGVTVLPSFDRELAAEWTGGLHGGVRASATLGELQILRAQAEVVGVGLVGAGASAVDTQIEVETSLSLHLPAVFPRGQTKGFGRQPNPGVGLAYRAFLPLEPNSHVPRAHLVLWNLVY